MCGETGCGAESPEDCCNIVYEEDSLSAPSKPQKKEPAVLGHSDAFGCVCFYVPTAEYTTRQYQETNKYGTSPMQLPFDLQEVGGQSSEARRGPPPQAFTRDICELPPHENLAIPYPRPAPSVELRGGQIYSGCQCVKRDGLQHDCPRTGCQGKPPCMAYPAPLCVPSGNAPPTPSPSPSARQREQWRRQGAAQQRGANAGGYHTPDDDDRYVRMGRCGYRENPPIKRRSRVPCEEHRKTRC